MKTDQDSDQDSDRYSGETQIKLVWFMTRATNEKEGASKEKVEEKTVLGFTDARGCS
jgi:hypothetical protein